MPRVDVVFNNQPLRPGLETSWGFACLIEGAGQGGLDTE